jgi:hypothetical protein
MDDILDKSSAPNFSDTLSAEWAIPRFIKNIDKISEHFRIQESYFAKFMSNLPLE